MLNWKKIFSSVTEFADSERDKEKSEPTNEDGEGVKGAKIVGIEKDGVILLCKHIKDQVFTEKKIF